MIGESREDERGELINDEAVNWKMTDMDEADRINLGVDCEDEVMNAAVRKSSQRFAKTRRCSSSPHHIGLVIHEYSCIYHLQ